MNNQYISGPHSETERLKQNDVGQIFRRFAYHWPLFAISLVITGALAFFYIKTINPVYHIKTKISIKDEKQKAAGDKEAVLQQLNLSTGPKLIESEVEVLKSRPLIRKVVLQLGLWAVYKENLAYKKVDLYKDSPVELRLAVPSSVKNNVSLSVKVIDDDYFLLSYTDGKTQKLPFGKKLTNNFGVWEMYKGKNFESYRGKTITIQLTPVEKVVSDYQNRIKTIFNKSAPIIELNLDDEAAERGTEVLDKLVSAYKSFNISDKNKETENTLKFIDERLVSLSSELTNVEKNVEGYKSNNGLTDISSMSQLYLDNVKDNDTRLNEVNVQLNVLEGIENYVSSSESGGNVPATIGITDPGLISLVGQLSKLQLQRDRLASITPESNPIFVPLDRQINSTKVAIRQTLKGIKTSLVATKRQFMNFNSGFEKNIKNIPGQERQYVSIKRQQAIKESLYIYLLQKREEVALSYASTLTDARTVETAFFEEPQTNKKLPFAVAIMSGLLLPICFLSLRAAMKNKVLTKRDIEAVTAAPVMCELIQETNGKTIVVLNREAYALGEQIRGLRTNILQNFSDRKQGNVALFVSSIAGEGKSFVSSNIAASLAAVGKKTVILELDLRKPKISKIFNLKNEHPGLTNYLSGGCVVSDIIQPSGVHQNLFVMGSGPAVYNPSELLESERLETLIETLKQDFDNIIIDSPPLHLVTDAMIISPLCDISLYIVRHNVTPKTELKFIEEVYKSGKLTNMNLVFNGVQMDSRYGYEVDYGYYSDLRKNGPWQIAFGNIKSRF